MNAWDTLKSGLTLGRAPRCGFGKEMTLSGWGSGGCFGSLLDSGWGSLEESLYVPGGGSSLLDLGRACAEEEATG